MQTSCRCAFTAPARPVAAHARRQVLARADKKSFDIDKIVSDLPVPVEYAYAGVAWGTLAEQSEPTRTIHTLHEYVCYGFHMLGCFR